MVAGEECLPCNAWGKIHYLIWERSLREPIAVRLDHVRYRYQNIHRCLAFSVLDRRSMISASKGFEVGELFFRLLRELSQLVLDVPISVEGWVDVFPAHVLHGRLVHWVSDNGNRVSRNEMSIGWQSHTALAGTVVKLRDICK